MEAVLVLQCKTPFSTPALRRRILPYRAKHSPSVLCVLTEPGPTGGGGVEDEVLNSKTTVHNGNLFDLYAINRLSKSFQSTSGLRKKKSGYEMEAVITTGRNYDPIQQPQIVVEALKNAIPDPFLDMMRTLLQNSKSKRELFALFTAVFSRRLVGTREVRESELNGTTEKNVTHIKKERYLEGNNYVGMCINLSKVPLNMVPYCDDMNCDTIYGEDPLPTTEDPAFKQPCNDSCEDEKNNNTSCYG